MTVITPHHHVYNIIFFEKSFLALIHKMFQILYKIKTEHNAPTIESQIKIKNQLMI